MDSFLFSKFLFKSTITNKKKMFSNVTNHLHNIPFIFIFFLTILTDLQLVCREYIIDFNHFQWENVKTNLSFFVVWKSRKWLILLCFFFKTKRVNSSLLNSVPVTLPTTPTFNNLIIMYVKKFVYFKTKNNYWLIFFSSLLNNNI